MTTKPPYGPPVRQDVILLRIVLSILFLVVLGSILFTIIYTLNGRDVPNWVYAVGAAAIGGLVGMFSPSFNSAELQSVQAERGDIQRRIEANPQDILNTIQLGLNQLNEYYVINKGQARNSFAFSLFATITGLITIVLGIWIFYFRSTPNFPLTALSTVPGILLQFIGGASFYIYRRSLDQLNLYFSQLVTMQDTMLAIKLSEQFEDPNVKNEVRQELIVTLMKRSSQYQIREVTPKGGGAKPGSHPPVSNLSPHSGMQTN